MHEFQNLHAMAKEKIHDFVRGHFYGWVRAQCVNERSFTSFLSLTLSLTKFGLPLSDYSPLPFLYSPTFPFSLSLSNPPPLPLSSLFLLYSISFPLISLSVSLFLIPPFSINSLPSHFFSPSPAPSLPPQSVNDYNYFCLFQALWLWPGQHPLLLHSWKVRDLHRFTTATQYLYTIHVHELCSCQISMYTGHMCVPVLLSVCNWCK